MYRNYRYNFTIDKIHDYSRLRAMQLENQADLITFYLEPLNLLDRIKSNFQVPNFAEKLVKIKK